MLERRQTRNNRRPLMLACRLALPALLLPRPGRAGRGAGCARAGARRPRPISRKSSATGNLICAVANVNGAEEERCQIAQLLRDGEDTTVAEVRVLRLPEGERGAAIATVTTPLGTLLPPGLALAVDGGEPAVYPFSFCSQARMRLPHRPQPRKTCSPSSAARAPRSP